MPTSKKSKSAKGKGEWMKKREVKALKKTTRVKTS